MYLCVCVSVFHICICTWLFEFNSETKTHTVYVLLILQKHGLNTRKFKKICIRTKAKNTRVPYYSKTRWLTKARTAKRVFNLLSQVKEFLKEVDNDLLGRIDNSLYKLQLAFIVDFTKELNRLNLGLQGKGRTYYEVSYFTNSTSNPLLIYRTRANILLPGYSSVFSLIYLWSPAIALISTIAQQKLYRGIHREQIICYCKQVLYTCSWGT